MDGEPLGQPPSVLGVAARSGVRWQTLAQAVDGAAGLGLTITLAHFIAPRVFGVVALSATISTVAATVLIGPVASSIVAFGYTKPRELSTVWWLAQIPSLTVYAIGAVVSLLFLSGAARSATLGAMLALPAGALAQTQVADYQQQLKFRQIAAASLIGTIASVTASLSLGISGAHTLALVARLVLAPLVTAGILMIALPRLPRLTLDRAVCVEVLGYARGLAGFNALNQLGRNGDNLLVGSALGSTALGLYNTAYRFISQPIGQLGGLAQTVIFPTLVRMTGRSFDLAFLRMSRLLLWVVAPVGAALIVLGDWTIVAVLGDKWRGAGTVVRVFGAIVVIQTVVVPAGILFQARRRTGLLFRWSAVSAPVILVSFGVGLPWGIDGVAWAYLAMNVVLLYPFWRLVSQLVDFSFGELASFLKPEVMVAVVWISAGLVARSALTIRGTAPVLGAIGLICVGYWMSVLVCDRDLRTDAVSLLPRMTPFRARLARRERDG